MENLKVYVQKIKRGKGYEGLPEKVFDDFDGQEHRIGCSKETYPARNDYYRVTVHGKSYRDENGKPRKKQYYICTLTFWELISDDCSAKVWDAYKKINKIAEEIGEGWYSFGEAIIQQVYSYTHPIRYKFESTKEGKVWKILREWENRKKEFFFRFRDANEKDFCICYDIYGNLVNPQHLQKLEQAERTRKAENVERGKEESDFTQMFNNLFSNGYTDDERVHLKAFYRTLAREYHPDHGGTLQQMQMLNKLKQEWGV